MNVKQHHGEAVWRGGKSASQDHGGNNDDIEEGLVLACLLGCCLHVLGLYAGAMGEARHGLPACLHPARPVPVQPQGPQSRGQPPPSSLVSGLVIISNGWCHKQVRQCRHAGGPDAVAPQVEDLQGQPRGTAAAQAHRQRQRA